MKYYSGKKDDAVTRKTQSVFVIVTSPRFAKASMAMKIVRIPDTPIGQAPAPPWFLSCARKTTKVVVPQITQENTCGLVAPFKMEPD
ncbi:hypothetical protein [Methylotuvimicrobium sp.]|uniref:hypothetical protein n=1 Tax=Methylotuvimicrobium sp. TaxID=2822413 RepID=UPI003D65BCEF